jgi:hypothetical protein
VCLLWCLCCGLLLSCDVMYFCVVSLGFIWGIHTPFDGYRCMVPFSPRFSFFWLPFVCLFCVFGWCYQYGRFWDGRAGRN